jgi:hypothetical protein
MTRPSSRIIDNGALEHDDFILLQPRVNLTQLLVNWHRLGGIFVYCPREMHAGGRDVIILALGNAVLTPTINVAM